MPLRYGSDGQAAASRSYLEGAAVTLPLTVVRSSNDTFAYGGVTYTVRPGTYSSLVALAGAVSDAQNAAHSDFGQVVTVRAAVNGLLFTSVPSGAITTAFAAGATSILAELGVMAGQTIAGTVTGYAAAVLHGHAYTGDKPTLQQLTAAQLADIYANSPFQAGINQAQYDTWLDQAYFMRHVFDSLNTDPFA